MLRSGPCTFVPILLLILFVSPVLGQQSRIGAPLDSRRTVRLRGNVPLEARATNDQGLVDAGQRMTGITLLFRKTPEQQRALEQLLEEQQNSASPNYHDWLTPEQYADRFGLDPGDLAKVVSWLESEGLSVDHVARSRNWIVFGGAAGEVQRVFSTEIHRYQVDGEAHFANSSEPSIPAGLEPVVLSLLGLDDFRLKAPSRKTRPVPSMSPAFTNGNGSHSLAPADIAAIYGISQLYSKGLTGSGQKIVVVGQSNFKLSDLQLFRRQFLLPANDPQLVLAAAPDPGITTDVTEALLDLEWTAAVAPNATIVYVYSTSVVFSLQYAIQQNLGPIISMSYGGCEQRVTSGSLNTTYWRSLAQQANAQGITWVASSGDSGGAGCDHSDQFTSFGGAAVNIPASLPEVTAVGGTEFNEGSGQYWNQNGTAVGYIPEVAWNDSASGGGLEAGGGGASLFFPKPFWQVFQGVPNDGARDLPDLSLAASGRHDGYLIVWNGGFAQVGGTSASTPVFAGILALLNQSLAQARPGLGNINPNLYRLASKPGIFHDITAGSNFVPCLFGTGCNGGRVGYPAGPGYDLATGLGSVDAFNLVTQWSSGGAVATTTTLTASPAGITLRDSTRLTASVRPATGTAAPAGSVSFSTGTTPLGTATLTGSTGTAVASLTVFGSQFKVGANSITASYSGSLTHESSSGPASVAVSAPINTSAVIPSVNPTTVYQQVPDSDGNAWFFTVRLDEVAGGATTLTGFTVNGTNYGQIATVFGTTQIAANGSLLGSVRLKGLSVPGTVVLGFSGTDPGGQQWTQQLSVPVYGQQTAAALSITSSISKLYGSAGDRPLFYFYIQELNGYPVQITRFVANGVDKTSVFSIYFNTTRVAPLGVIAAVWGETLKPPAPLVFVVEGIDLSGNKVTASLTIPVASGPSGVFPASYVSTYPDSSISFQLASPLATGSRTISVSTAPAGLPWSVSIEPANQSSSWLTAYPLSGRGSGTVVLTASGAGMSRGVYRAQMVIQSLTTDADTSASVTMTVGALSTTTKITSVTNAASFKPKYAPGMVASVFGTKLANSTQAASSVPLPLSMGGVSVQLNGAPVPLYYIFPGQLNIQIPYEVSIMDPIGDAALAVNNNGELASYTMKIFLDFGFTNSGVFADANGRTVPISSGKRGGTATIFVTGDGDVTPPVATGDTPTSGTTQSKLPQPLYPCCVSLTVGGVAAKINFVGIPSGLVGVTQVNFTVPQDAPLGPQPIVFKVISTASPPVTFTVLP